MEAEIQEVMTEISGKVSEQPVIVEYGSDTVNLSDEVFDVNRSHSNMYVEYTVDGETELAAFSTKDVGEHEIVYSYKISDKYDQKIRESDTVVYEVKDTQAPVVELKEEAVETYVGELYDVSNLVENVYDVIDGDLPNIDELAETVSESDQDSLKSNTRGYYEIVTDYNEDSPVGEYEVTVKAVDCNGLTSEAKATVKVVEKPVKIVVASGTPAQVTPSYTSYDPSRIYVGNYTAVIYFTAEDQAAVDAPDSAICYTQHGMTVVADHAYQGFSAILSNNTAVLLGQRIHKVSTHYGTVSEDRKDSYYDDGGSFLTNYDGPIVMYTCIEGENRQAVTYWDYD